MITAFRHWYTFKYTALVNYTIPNFFLSAFGGVWTAVRLHHTTGTLVWSNQAGGDLDFDGGGFVQGPIEEDPNFPCLSLERDGSLMKQTCSANKNLVCMCEGGNTSPVSSNSSRTSEDIFLRVESIC